MSEANRVVAAMSGGVDSAVAAGLLVEAGYDVVGMTMKMYAPTKPSHAKSCCGADDFDDARRSAATLGIPHYVLDFEETFRRERDRALRDRLRDRPNAQPVRRAATISSSWAPCALRRPDRARVRRDRPLRPARARPRTARGCSAARRQRPSLRARAAHARPTRRGCCFRSGELDEVADARPRGRLGLAVAEKTESQDICFVEGGDYRDVLARVAPDEARPGAIVDTAGERRRRRTPGSAATRWANAAACPAAGDGPRYVTRIDAATNTIVIGREDELDVDGLRRRRGQPAAPRTLRRRAGARCCAMTRYRAVPARPRRRVEPDGTLRLHSRAAAGGHAGPAGRAVDLDGDEVLGAATIRQAV